MKLNTATVCGLLAIVLWSSIVGLVRSTAGHFGPITGAAGIYTLGTVLLLIFVGFPRFKQCSAMYLAATGVLFTAYEICLSLAIGFAHSSRQAIEVSMLNYLWPCLTVLVAIWMNRQRARWMIVPGSLLALFGVFWILSGSSDESGSRFSLAEMLGNLADNPLSYGMALAAAFIWAFYCNITKRFAGGQNGITLFFAMTSASLWLMHLLGHHTIPEASFSAYVEIIIAAAAMACGYALWNIGILRGNMTFLATASYFTPVLSCAFAALWLGHVLGWQFWEGVGLVTGGSLLCWWSTRRF